MSEKIAIIAWGAMADVLYATPIVSLIRRKFPKAHITWLIRDKFSDIVQGNKDINKVRTFKLSEDYPSRQDAEYVMDKEILAYAQREEFSRFFDLQYWPRHSNFYERPNEDFISLRARNAGIDATTIIDRSITLEVSNKDEREALKFILTNVGNPDKYGIYPQFITVNHISYAASPAWSFDNYDQLVDILDHEYNILAIFTGAPNEPIPEHCIDARGMPYCQWAELIAMSDLWLGLDSGAVALACASDVPIIKLHSGDFPLAKTGIKSMGLRHKDVLELCPAPNPEAMSELIVENMR